MAGKFCASLTAVKDNSDKATVAYVVANATAGSDQETMIFLSTEGVHLSQRGYTDIERARGFTWSVRTCWNGGMRHRYERRAP